MYYYLYDAMYGFVLPSVMRSVRDSHCSGDYRKGTGTQVLSLKTRGVTGGIRAVHGHSTYS
jgi:hypothetical protein